MRVTICEDKHDMGYQAAKLGLAIIREAIEKHGRAYIVVATGLSQFSLYAHLGESDVDWSKVEAFGLNEYVGISDSHPSSFRYYLNNRFVKKVLKLGAFHAINGDAEDLPAEIARLNALIADQEIDVAFLGIGENGHIGFNDPPANFETNDPYIIVDLEERCRRQQVSEGWFPTLEEVPTKAITMSVRQILKARNLICSVPDQRKARAVAMCMYDQISVYAPCSALRTKKECTLLLDRPSSLLVMGDRR
nr:glucosamine-6-phosphate deaminase [uncultured Sphaerochaeta sp.]